MIDWIRETMLAEGKISPEDMDLFHLTDDPEETVALILAEEDEEAVG